MAEADVILHHGKVVTVDKTFSSHQALAIEGNRIRGTVDDRYPCGRSDPHGCPGSPPDTIRPPSRPEAAWPRTKARWNRA
jgi:hypothetical protein